MSASYVVVNKGTQQNHESLTFRKVFCPHCGTEIWVDTNQTGEEKTIYNWDRVVEQEPENYTNCPNNVCANH